MPTLTLRCSDCTCPFPPILAKLDAFILNPYQPERQKVVSHFNLHFLIRFLRILIFYLKQKFIGQGKEKLISTKIREAKNACVST